MMWNINRSALIILAALLIEAGALTGQNNNQNDKNFFIRGYAGAQGKISLIFPVELTEYTQDFYDHLLDEWGNYGYFPDMMNIPPVYSGYGYTLKAGIRLFNVFQVEPWWEMYKSFPLQIRLDAYYYDGYSGYSREIDMNYKFRPMYDALGASLLFVPGSSDKPVFFTFGGGIGSYIGKLSIETDGSETINDNTTPVYDYEEYSGKAIGYHGSIGMTYVPWKYLELESLLTGRYVKIPEMEDAAGYILTNQYDDNQPVVMQLSGIDFRFGIKFIFP